MEKPQIYRIEVWTHRFTSEKNWVRVINQVEGLSVNNCFVNRLYFVQGRVSRADVERLAADLLVDPVTEEAAVVGPDEAVCFPDADYTIDFRKAQLGQSVYAW